METSIDARVGGNGVVWFLKSNYKFRIVFCFLTAQIETLHMVENGA